MGFLTSHRTGAGAEPSGPERSPVPTIRAEDGAEISDAESAATLSAPPTSGLPPDDGEPAAEPGAEADGSGTPADPHDGPVAREAPPAVAFTPEPAPAGAAATHPGVMIPARSGRSAIESFFMRIIASAGIVGIGVAIAAIMQSQNSKGWMIGLVVAIVSMVLAAVLWSSQRL